jgi:Tol biopolymer transport system component
MKMKKRTFLMVVLALGLAAGVANAGFLISDPANLGPPINSEGGAASVAISADGLELYFVSERAGGSGEADIWVATRPTTEDDWGEPINLGSVVNSSAWDAEPAISADGLSLYFASGRAGGLGQMDIYLTTRPTKDDPWSEPVGLEPPVNGPAWDDTPYITADGLELYFASDRAGGYGLSDVYVATRLTTEDPWSAPVNLGPGVNTEGYEGCPYLSSDGLTLFHYGFNRPGHPGNVDIWVAKRLSVDDAWGTSVKLGPEVNCAAADTNPCLSPDDSILYFQSMRSGGLGGFNLWQVSFSPIVDLNADGAVDVLDAAVLLENWGVVGDPTGPASTLCDIAPLPLGDGVVDAKDLLVLAEHMIEDAGAVGCPDEVD